MKTIFQNPEDIFLIIALKLLKIGNRRNSILWGYFFHHLVLTFNPKKLLDTLHEYYFQYEGVGITKSDYLHSISLSINLDRDSTINSIIKIIKKNKGEIVKAIHELKTKSPKTEIEALKIKRDYFIYNVYTSHKSPRRRMDYIENIRKELAVTDKAEELLNEKEYEEIDKLDWKSVRKIVSRMNQRIRQSFIDKSDGIGNLLTAIETTEPAPYPEYVADRLTTRRHSPKK